MRVLTVLFRPVERQEKKRLLLASLIVFCSIFAGSASVAQTVQQSITLKSGWNMISLRVRPTNTSFPAIFSPIASNVTLVKDQEGRSYSPGYKIDNLSPWDPTKAYLVHVRTADTLVVTGDVLDPAKFTLGLVKGWNIVPFISGTPSPIEEALSPILSKIVMVKSSDGKVFSPSQSIDDIGQMVPGEGYRMYMTDQASFSYSATVVEPPATAPSAPGECLASANAHSVTEFGSWTPSNTTAAVVRANTVTINAAIDQVGRAGGGTICLPAGDYHVSPLDTTKVNSTAITVAHSNITLWGAGMYAAQGGTAIHTRSRFHLVNGQVSRGTGIWILGTRLGEPRSNITFRDFELDGGAGYTGKFSWPANPLTGDGWDVTHKGIILTADTNVDDVLLERMYVHSYKGEIIYAGGGGLGDLTIRKSKIEDTNASTINFTANFVIEDSEFGRSSIWNEVGVHLGVKSGVFRNNYFHDAARFGLNFAQGDYSAQPYLVEGNKFENCGSQALFFGGGIEGPITVRNNEFVNCAILATGYGGAGGRDSRNIVVENNVATGIKGEAFYLSSQATNITIRNNTITAGRSGAYCCGNLNNILVADNKFTSMPPVEHGSGLTTGERPLFKNNTYTAAPYFKPLSLTEPKYKPLYEVGPVKASVPNVPIVLETGFYPDGQVVQFIGGSANYPVKFAAGSASYYVAQDRYLTGSNSIWMRYNKSKGIWEEIAAP